MNLNAVLERGLVQGPMQPHVERLLEHSRDSYYSPAAQDAYWRMYHPSLDTIRNRSRIQLQWGVWSLAYAGRILARYYEREDGQRYYLENILEEYENPDFWEFFDGLFVGNESHFHNLTGQNLYYDPYIRRITREGPRFIHHSDVVRTY